MAFVYSGQALALELVKYHFFYAHNVGLIKLSLEDLLLKPHQLLIAPNAISVLVADAKNPSKGLLTPQGEFLICYTVDRGQRIDEGSLSTVYHILDAFTLESGALDRHFYPLR